MVNVMVFLTASLNRLFDLQRDVPNSKIVPDYLPQPAR